MNIKNIIKRNTVGGRAILLLMMLAVLLFGGFNNVRAQSTEGSASVSSALDTIPEDARAIFESHIEREDTARQRMLKQHRRDKLIKRFSIHTNVLEPRY